MHAVDARRANDAAIRRSLTLPEGQETWSLARAVAAALELGPADTGASVLHLGGVAGSGAARLAAQLAERAPVLLVTSTQQAAVQAVEDLAFFAGDDENRKPRLIYGSEQNPYHETQPERRSAMSRMATLARLSCQPSGHPLVANATALVRRVPPRRVVQKATRQLTTDHELDITQLAEDLTASGYLRVPIVEDPGSFALRGGLLDVWAPLEPVPTRVEMFGDEVMTMRDFEPDSQRTLSERRELLLPPARETILSKEVVSAARSRLRQLCDEANYPSIKARQLIEELTTGKQLFGVAGYLPAFYDLETVFDYLPSDVRVIIEQPERVIQVLRQDLEALRFAEQAGAAQPRFSSDTLVLDEVTLETALAGLPVVSCSTVVTLGAPTSLLEGLEQCVREPPSLAQADHRDLEHAVKEARASMGKRAALDPLLERLYAWHEAGLQVSAVARATTQARRLASVLRHREIPFRLVLDSADNTEELPELDEDARNQPANITVSGQPPLLTIRAGNLARGVIAPADGEVWVTEEEIFGHRAHAPAKKRKKRFQQALDDLRALTPGDHVVHIEHGVGKYVGLENRPGPGGTQLELLVVEYSGGRLYLPVYRLNQVQKFTGGNKPKMDRLGGQSFHKTKARAKKKARDMADRLLRLYADRNNAEREPIAEPDAEYVAFEAAFPFEETADQAAAIQEVVEDLRKPVVMDRLVCGDVGFGKTEVALRAAFLCAYAGRQVAILCPTTVLAQQHFLSFSRRLANYPLTVRVLSRFQSKANATETLKGLREGSVDIVVGTHRLLSKDLAFKNLGLLVIDEEQRFGVTHKERLKELKTQVDVLTLTATPIPRTLQLAVGGLRDMSIISTPPRDRRAIRTVVSRVDETIIQEAIERELSRGGQVFYVYNRVEGLYERAERLKRLLPNARIAVGHGQLKEATLERTMLDFVEGEYDVLVATSIVESGLDIPRANTMIIDRADLFGLAQLYQLRGRVGRSQERAYCYLLVPPLSEMNEDARSRIEALERYTELGSGFVVATLDMELRGAGDLLGGEQSGTVATVGLDLFCSMLEEATQELRGEEVVHDIDPELTFDVEALLPDAYISEVGVRLSLYKRLASAISEAEVVHLGSEMEDRFGTPPVEAQRLVELMRIKAELRRLKVEVCEATSRSVSFRLRDDTPLEAGRLAQLVAKQSAKYRLTPDGRLSRRTKESERFRDSLELAEHTLAELRDCAGLS